MQIPPGLSLLAVAQKDGVHVLSKTSSKMESRKGKQCVGVLARGITSPLTGVLKALECGEICLILRASTAEICRHCCQFAMCDFSMADIVTGSEALVYQWKLRHQILLA